MQKAILLCAGMILAAAARSQFSFGPRAGINISKENYSNTNVYSTSSHNFFTAGVFARYRTRKNIAAEISINYSPEGTAESYKSGNNTVTGVVTIKRINIPLLAQYHTQTGVYVETGPQIGFVTQAYGDYTNGHYEFKSGTQSSLTSWLFGAGYILRQKLPGLGINASYAKGLSSIQKGTVNAGKITGSTFSVKLFYGFRMQKHK